MITATLHPAMSPVVSAVDGIGDTVKARHILRTANVPRRVALAYEIAVDAVDALRAKGADARLSSKAGHAPSLDHVKIMDADAQGIHQALMTEGNATVSRRWPCPSCGDIGHRVGSAPLMRTGIPYGMVYFDLDRLLAPWRDHIEATDLEWDLVVALLMQRGHMQAPVAQCGCELLYVDWPFDQARIDRFYSGRQTADHIVDGVALSGRATSPAYVYSKLAIPLHVEAVVGSLAGKSVYDLGCAEGVMAEGFRRLGATVAGGDLDRGKIAYARTVFGIDIGDIRQSDLVVCFHVLEHLVRVEPWLSTMADALSPGGHLVVSVPNSTIRDGIGVEMGGDHLIGFSASALKTHIERAGMHVVDMRVDDGSTTDRDNVLRAPSWSARPLDITVIATR